jgi:hypothetical protein
MSSPKARSHVSLIPKDGKPFLITRLRFLKSYKIDGLFPQILIRIKLKP